jgi:hypothetical protein
VHHKDGNSSNHDQANLRVLCGPDSGGRHRIEGKLA